MARARMPWARMHASDTRTAEPCTTRRPSQKPLKRPTLRCRQSCK
jgi:hypothetical protein